MKNADIFLKVIDTIIKIGGRNTSENYMKVVLDTLINRERSGFQALKHISVKNSINIDSTVNDLDGEEVGNAINKILNEIAGIAGDKDGRELFFIEFKGYLGHDSVLKLQKIGVKINK